MRPDKVLVLETSKQMAMLALTVPLEEKMKKMEKAKEKKQAKYAYLVAVLQTKVESMVQGFAAQSLCKTSWASQACTRVRPSEPASALVHKNYSHSSKFYFLDLNCHTFFPEFIIA